MINAPVNNPHIADNFNVHPRAVEEYGEILRNLDKHLDVRIDTEEVYG